LVGKEGEFLRKKALSIKARLHKTKEKGGGTVRQHLGSYNDSVGVGGRKKKSFKGAGGHQVPAQKEKTQ